jgi:carboxyl-terminal processing protease
MKKLMNTRKFYYGGLLVLAMLVVQVGKAQSVEDNIRKLATAMQIIKFAYVDTVNDTKLVEKAIIETLKELDPHSYYISKEDLERINEPLVGSFEGIGISFQIYQDTLLVISPIPGGPSQKVGIQAGDKIIKINEDVSYGDVLNNQYVFDRLRGPKGSKVDVTIVRKSRKEPLVFTIVRDKIPMNSIDATFMVSDEIGYIRLDRFSQTSYEEFEKSMAELKADGMQKLILDLRGNSGGLMKAAVLISDDFLREGKMIVYTQGLNSPRNNFVARTGGSFENNDVVVLINEGSASASEIVAGAVQDHDRGIVIGRRSFGKGLVQNPYRLPDGSVIRLTTAKYYTPSGRSIQKPYKDGLESYFSEMYLRLEKGELMHPDSIQFPDSLRYLTAGNRVVYGGGGIMPDVFVPFDSTRFSNYYSDLIRKGAFNDYIINYIDRNRKSLNKKYETITAFIKGFEVDSRLVDEFIAFAEKKEVKFDEKGYEAAEQQIIYSLKGLIARNLWDMEAYYRVIANIDPELKKAIQVLKEQKEFKNLSYFKAR